MTNRTNTGARLMGETPTPADDATVEAIAALRRGVAATEIDTIWIEQVEILEAEIERLRALPDPRPTEAEVRAASNVAGNDWLDPLRELGCFRPEAAGDPDA